MSGKFLHIFVKENMILFAFLKVSVCLLWRVHIGQGDSRETSLEQQRSSGDEGERRLEIFITSGKYYMW